MTNNNQEMNNKKKKHVAVFVFPFASHPGSLFNLVLKLANATPNTLFSFLGTEQSNKPLFSKTNNINVIPNNLNFYTVADGIPKGHVLLSNNPLEKINFFLEAAPENLQKGLDLAVETKKEKVTCIISDAFVPASLDVAQKLNVPWVALWTCVPSSLSAHYYTDIIRQKYYCADDDNNAKEDITLDFIPGFSKMRVGDLPHEVININGAGGDQEETLFSKTLGSLCKVLPKAKAVVFSFFEEIDLPLVVEDMRSKFESLLYVGFFSLTLPLPPLPQSESDETGCLSWLDKQKDRSVVYVCFGTVTTPAPHEIVGLAEALEASGFPFLWALNDYLKGLLPNGFVERTSICGKIVTWAPQAHVLGHDSVGVYVTHSGTNSVSEGVSNGVPMIIRPFFADQGMTGRMVEDVWETGVRIEGGVFTKNGLLKSLNMIMVSDEGKKMREKAEKLKMTVVDAAGPQGRAAQDFNTLVELVSYRAIEYVL